MTKAATVCPAIAYVRMSRANTKLTPKFITQAVATNLNLIGTIKADILNETMLKTQFNFDKFIYHSISNLPVSK